MGMFDTIVDANANDWQTKAMGCDLTRYYIGDEIGSGDFQMLTIGGGWPGEYVWAYVTVRNGRVSEVGVPRDPSLPCIDYHGGPRIDPKETSHDQPE